jgi:hypothetical protein
MPKNKHEHNPKQVNAYMDKLDHPLKAEAQAIREMILNINPNITEQIKWNAPSFSYKGYMVTFNLRSMQYVHLIFHNGAILPNDSGLLEGDYPDRRMVYFSSMDDVKAKQAALESAINAWIAAMDSQPASES